MNIAFAIQFWSLRAIEIMMITWATFTLLSACVYQKFKYTVFGRIEPHLSIILINVVDAIGEVAQRQVDIILERFQVGCAFEHGHSVVIIQIHNMTHQLI